MREKEKFTVENYVETITSIPIHSYNTIIIGSGCAAFNAADSLVDLGQKDIAIVTEGLNMGTSRNTGSDKQTYYKLSLASSTPDSVYDMAKVLYNGQSVHGDLALVEAALSARCFYKLVNLQVPFPHDCFGQYVGYKTDHDPSQRATSCGPLTSKYMVEKLEQSVKNKSVKIFDGYRIISLITDELNEKVIGAIAIDESSDDNFGLTLFNCTNIIYATGGPSAIYYNSVYPQSQTCAHGAALLCGAKANNVTEWQYGIASKGFRWNLSGSYQQVIPRYISTKQDGSGEKEFLQEYFETTSDMLNAIFLKGYQWPFDPKKIVKSGSSLVDIAVYREINEKGRRVFLDYTNNPKEALRNGEFSFELLSEESFNYLKNSKVLFGKPIDRLRAMNEPAYQLYKNNGVDLENELLEISVCAQHNNGGLSIDKWWQSNIKNLFPVGEVSGNFGVYRPGGSALNATQVGSLRASQYISKRCMCPPMNLEDFKLASVNSISEAYKNCCKLMSYRKEKKSPYELREHYQREMDLCGAMIRSKNKIKAQTYKCKDYLDSFIQHTYAKNKRELVDAFINKDILVTQLVYLHGMLQYIEEDGKSRGSYMITEEQIDYSQCKEHGIKVTLDNGERAQVAQEIQLTLQGLKVENVECRPLPEDNSWFEVIYNDYLNDKIIGE